MLTVPCINFADLLGNIGRIFKKPNAAIIIADSKAR